MIHKASLFRVLNPCSVERSLLPRQRSSRKASKRIAMKMAYCSWTGFAEVVIIWSVVDSALFGCLSRFVKEFNWKF